MTPEAWLTILGSGLLAAIIPAAIGAWQQRQARKVAAPREDAETDEVIVNRVTKENERLSKRLKDQDDRIDALAHSAEKALIAADMAKALAREQGASIDELKLKHQSALRFIAQLIVTWPPNTIPVPAIPDDLVAD